ncbi:M20/M25/M40 family metallo-hydrolase [Phenylobacterium sp.]|jgi:Zn-dependent M28 family amino/carboxypeptidase|uniref:M20/M25/M40 family metallo-hydrolase n=1 Tax=Phenylobacterium sp. TaxID=1871053 RepID=UPI002F91D69C
MLRLAAVAAAVLCLGAAPADRILDDVRVLSADDMQGREIGSPGSAKARAYLLQRFNEIGLKPVGATFEQPFAGVIRGQPRDGVNLVGRIEGRSPSGPILLVSAHYDHLGVQNGEVFNGADDNASGVAAVLAIAEAFREDPPRHTVIIALWDGEEGGLAGSRAFVKAYPARVARTALIMNLDMVGRGDKDELYVAGASHYPFLKPRLEALATRARVKLKLGHDGPPWTGHEDWTHQSDHAAFHAAKVPFAYFGVEDHPDYHKPTDHFEKIPAAFYRRSVATLVEAARMFDRELGAIAKESGRSF